MRTAADIARDLERVRRQQATLEARYTALRKELLDLCVPRREFEIPPYTIQVVKFTTWKPGVVQYLADHGWYEALRPVNEALDRMYTEGTVTFSDLSPYLERTGLSYRLVRAETTDPKFAGAYSRSVRSQFAASAPEPTPTPFEEAHLQQLTAQLRDAVDKSSP